MAKKKNESIENSKLEKNSNKNPRIASQKNERLERAGKEFRSEKIEPQRPDLQGKKFEPEREERR